MFNFDGQFKSKKMLSFRGSSKHAEKPEELVEKARRERERRAQQKAEEKAAITIQNRWRHYAKVKAAREQQRELFDTELRQAAQQQMPSPETLFKLIARLAFFFVKKHPNQNARKADMDRLLQLSVMLILNNTQQQQDASKRFTTLAQHEQTADLFVFRIKNLLAICTICLEEMIPSVDTLDYKQEAVDAIITNNRILTLMRLPLMFLQGSVYKTGNNFVDLCLHLVTRCNFFGMLRKCLMLLWHPSRPHITRPFFLCVTTISQRVITASAASSATQKGIETGFEFGRQLLTIPLLAHFVLYNQTPTETASARRVPTVENNMLINPAVLNNVLSGLEQHYNDKLLPSAVHVKDLYLFPQQRGSSKIIVPSSLWLLGNILEQMDAILVNKPTLITDRIKISYVLVLQKILSSHGVSSHYFMDKQQLEAFYAGQEGEYDEYDDRDYDDRDYDDKHTTEQDEIAVMIKHPPPPPPLMRQLIHIFDRHHIQSIFESIVSGSTQPERLVQFSASSTPFGGFGGANPFAISTSQAWQTTTAAAAALAMASDPLCSFCCVYNTLLDFTGDQAARMPDQQQTLSVRHMSLLNTLSFLPNFLPQLWSWLMQHDSDWANNLDIPTGTASVLSLFSNCYSHLLEVIDDDEFYSGKNTFSLSELVTMSHMLKELAFRMHWDACTNKKLQENISRLVRKIYDRDSRRKFCPQDHWLVKQVYKLNFSSLKGSTLLDPSLEQEIGVRPSDQPQPMQMDEEEDVPMHIPSLHVARMSSLRQALRQRDYSNDTGASSSSNNNINVSDRGTSSIIANEELKALNVLKNMPFVIPFDTRVNIFRRFIAEDKETLDPGRWSPPVQARREFIFEDGFAKLSALSPAQLKNRLQIRFISPEGYEEAGVGEGVFKEFLTELCKKAFDAYGLFKYTSDGMLYPNPSAHVVSSDYLNHFEFLGRMIGKAMYEQILVEVPFARFFLSKLLGKSNYLNDLPSLDPELYRNLTFLKNYDGNVEELALNFTIVDNEFGESIEHELIPGGRNIPVTNENRLSYIHRVAHFRLNTQIKPQSDAFLRGLRDIIPPKWLRMFDQSELRLLISGNEADFDVEDLRAHAVYAGGYTQDHPTIKLFWGVVHEMTHKERALLLKFATSCSRPPLLGFRNLFPPFCIQKSSNDAESLPTSSTCVNLLKLPAYTSKAELKQKLLYAISNCTGFELT